MDNEQLIELLSETLLIEVIAAKVEEVDQLPIMLQNIGYIEELENVLSKITFCEAFESDLDIIHFTQEGKSILITYKLTFLLSAWHQKQQLLRITASATGTCQIPGIESYDWESVDFGGMNKKELLANRGLMSILELNYSDVEADEVNFSMQE
jgi:hypothetical protein